MPLLGAHMSIVGGPDKALRQGSEVGCKAIQIFTRNRLRWTGKELSSNEIIAFRGTRDDTSVVPIAIHCSYLINLASPDKDKRKQSYQLLLKEMEWASKLDIPYLVLHPGFHMGMGEDAALKTVGKMIKRVFHKCDRCKIEILLETTAGQGTCLGFRFEHFAEILKFADSDDRIGVCFDTSHVFASGYDFRKKEAYGQMMEEFDTIIGIDRLRLFHINDSRSDAGSMIDRHDHPGKGLIGLKPFSFFLHDTRFIDHSFILETPKGNDENGVDLDIVNLKKLSNLRKEL